MTEAPETRYRVRGGTPLSGTVFVQGAKNAALKMIAASLLTGNGRTVLRNVPPIEDVRRAVELAQALGAVVEFHEAERTLVVDASNLTSPVLPAEIARRFRGAVLFVPALLHRFGEAVIEGVGGCNLGSRSLDFHYRGFTRLGAVVDEGETEIRIKASKLQGAHLYLDTPSHTGTENLIMAASLAPGKTIIDNCAQEPEVLDVIAFLTKMGARISGGGTGFITVHGVDELTAVEHTVMADRIDAGVFAMAAAITGGELNLVGASLDHFGVVRWKLEQMGVEFSAHGAVLNVRRDRPLRPINVITGPYPGFATDLQSPIMALACLAEGASYIRETIFDGRYTLVGELNKMGAKVEFDGNVAIAHGPASLHGTEVVAHDLRTGIALVLAGLAAEGETVVAPGYLIDRGHAAIVQRFAALGASVTPEQGLTRRRLLVQLLDVLVQVRAIGHVRGISALLVAADHADDRPGPGDRVEAGKPRAAAGAAGEIRAGELELVLALLAGPVPAGDRRVRAGRVAGHLDQVVEPGVERDRVRAEHVLDVLAVQRVKHHERDVEGGIGAVHPARVQHVPRGRPYPVRAVPAGVIRDELDVRPIRTAVARVDAVRGRDQHVAARAVHHAGRAEVIAAAVAVEQCAHPGRVRAAARRRGAARRRQPVPAVPALRAEQPVPGPVR
jgi:UDP-N-acetylglucosamine 1-carboxyvinyltransferase